MIATTYNGCQVRPADAVFLNYKGTHNGQKKGKNLQPKVAAKPNKKSAARLEKRIAIFTKSGGRKGKHVHTRPGSNKIKW